MEIPEFLSPDKEPPWNDVTTVMMRNLPNKLGAYSPVRVCVASMCGIFAEVQTADALG